MTPEQRLAALRARLYEERVDAIMVSDPVNVAYLTAFDGVFDEADAHAAIITDDACLLYTDGRYAEAVREAALGTDWVIRVPAENLYSTACSELASAGVASLAIEESVPYGRFRYVSQCFDGNVEPVDQWIEEIRQVKSAEEIARISRAQELADDAFEFLLGMLKPGLSERDVALKLEFEMRRRGAEAVSFPPIIASGPNSSRPHAGVTSRCIQPGDFVKMDFGAKVDGYCSDMTRTVVVGTASDGQRDVYEAVKAANEAGLRTARAGIPGSEVDAAARKVIEERGYGPLFTHSLGHGVGMEVHELPTLGPRGTKSLRAGSVVTIEPGVYEPGVGGVRIEDLIVVEEAGVRVLSRSTKDLIEL